MCARGIVSFPKIVYNKRNQTSARPTSLSPYLVARNVDGYLLVSVLLLICSGCLLLYCIPKIGCVRCRCASPAAASCFFANTHKRPRIPRDRPSAAMSTQARSKKKRDAPKSTASRTLTRSCVCLCVWVLGGVCRAPNQYTQTHTHTQTPETIDYRGSAHANISVYPNTESSMRTH